MLKPLHDRVLLRLISSNETKIGSLHVVDSQERMYARGEVLAVGPGMEIYHGTLLDKGSLTHTSMQAKEGDIAVIQAGVGVLVVREGETYCIVRDGDILAVDEEG